MLEKKHLQILLWILLLFVGTYQPAYAAEAGYAGCGWNPFCHAAKFFIGDPLSAAMPEVKARVNLNHKIENVDELREFVHSVAKDAEGVIEVTGGETRLTIEKASQELTDYTAFLDTLAGRRIADLDERVQAKLLWIQQYSEQVNQHVQEIIRVASQEMQTVIGVTSDEAQEIILSGGSVAQETIRVGSGEMQAILSRGGYVMQDTTRVIGDELEQVIGTGGQVMQDTIQLTGEELRFSVLTASGEVKEIVTQISTETQDVVRLAADEIDESIDNTFEGLDRLLHTAEGSSLRILEGSLYIVERGADLTLALGSAAAGLVFLFVSTYGWGRAILREKMPDPGLTRKFVIALMIATFCAALLPFGFLSRTARAYALLPFDQTSVYARVIGKSREQFRPNLEVTSIKPDAVVVRTDGQDLTESLSIEGIDLLEHGYPTVTFGQYELPVTGTEELLKVGLSVVNGDVHAARLIEIQFGEDESGLRQVAVLSVDPPPTATPTVLPTKTPTPLPTSTLVPAARVAVNQRANIRSGPGNYPIVGGATPDNSFEAVGRSRDANWIQIRYGDQLAWVYGALVTFTVNGPIDEIDSPGFLPFPTPIPGPTPCTPPTTASFVASSSTIVRGQATILSWGAVQNADSVGIEGGEKPTGVDFAGELQVAPRKTTVYKLVALSCGGQKQVVEQVTVNVHKK